MDDGIFAVDGVRVVGGVFFHHCIAVGVLVIDGAIANDVILQLIQLMLDVEVQREVQNLNSSNDSSVRFELAA